MRIPLAVLIVVVQVAGPWLCCCAPARVSAAFAVKPTELASSDAPAKPAGGCPHCKTDDAPKAPTPAPTDSAPDQLPKQCPCGGAEIVAVPADRPAENEVLPTVAVEPFAFAAFPSPVLSLAVASVPGLRELPWLTTDEILYAHHVLRC